MIRKAISLALLVASLGFGQGVPLPDVQQQQFGATGLANSAGFVCTYAAGTTTPLATYSDVTLVTNAHNPIQLNASGRPVAWMTSTEIEVFAQARSYKVVVHAAGTGSTCNGTSVGAPISTRDNISAANVYTVIFATKNFDNVRHCDQFAGANAGAKIAACIADLPPTGGTADARGFEGAQGISSTITIDRPVHLLLGAANYTCTMTSGICIAVTSGETFIYGMAQGGTTQITYNGTSAVKIISFDAGAALIGYIGVYDLMVRFSAGGHNSQGIYVANPVGCELDRIYVSVDGTTGPRNEQIEGIKLEVNTNSLVPPPGNCRIANYIHGNSHDGSAVLATAKGLWLKGITGTNGSLENIALEGHGDVESSGAGIQFDHVVGATIGGEWFVSGNDINYNIRGSTGVMCINCRGQNATNSGGSNQLNFNIVTLDAITSQDVILINPILSNPAIAITDNGTRTAILNGRTGAISWDLSKLSLAAYSANIVSAQDKVVGIGACAVSTTAILVTERCSQSSDIQHWDINGTTPMAVDSSGRLKVGTGGTPVTTTLSTTGTVDFAAWGGTDCQDIAVTFTGALTTDSIFVTLNGTTMTTFTNVVLSAWVDSTNNVIVRGCKITAGASGNPGAITARLDLWRH